jgi:riboflavin synthase
VVSVFTGLVQEVGTVQQLDRSNGGVTLTVKAQLAGRLCAGDSVAVNGVCLTATDVGAEHFQANVMNETLARSSLGAAQPGTPVNLELALRAGEPLGGHMVQGHVDGLGQIAEAIDDGFARRIRVEADPDLLRYVVEKGSITLDGVSLTVVDVDDRSFKVSLIPETLERTNLGAVRDGTPVNLEVDIVAKYVEKLVVR